MKLELPPLRPPPQARSAANPLAGHAAATAHERPDLGRNLTDGLLEFLGRAIVTGRFDDAPFPIEEELVRR